MTLLKDYNFAMNSAGKVFCRPGWQWDCRTALKDFDLWCILGGQGEMTVEKETYKLSQGDCFLLHPGIQFFADNKPEEPLTVVYTHFDIFKDGRKISALKESPLPDFHRKIQNVLFFESLLQKMLGCWYRNDTDNAILWLSAALCEAGDDTEEKTTGNKSNSLTETAKDLYKTINEHPEEKYSLRKIAKNCGTCPEHFSRIFKKSTNCSFREAVTASKIRRAELLLSSTDYSVTKVSEILGFGDIYQFSKLFKKQTGMSPSTIRRT
ncbi:MAG: AraC family transcriptional regulator [Verrucomicrobia bacterium]|nr:AraC family transcriptional regulator [Verrucomicrobiota bacterium]